MRAFVILLLVLAAGVGVWLFLKKNKASEPQQQTAPVAVIKHSSQLNAEVNAALDSYYDLTEAFVQWDSLTVTKQAESLKSRLDSIHIDELKKESANRFDTAQKYITSAKNDIQEIEKAITIVDKRHGLNALSNDIFNFLQAVQYTQAKLYLQECPMAFNDEDPGDWLSKSPTIRNPYMGLHHPRYGQAMITCGDTKDTLNFSEIK